MSNNNGRISDKDPSKNQNVDRILDEIKSEAEQGSTGERGGPGGQGGTGGQGGPGTPGGAGGVGGRGGEGGSGYFPKPKAEMPKQRVFEKQFLVLIAVMIVGTAVFAFNPYLVLQGQEVVKEIAVNIQNIAKNAVEQNAQMIEHQALQTKILTSIFDQNQEEEEAREESRRQLGDQWLKFMNAMLVDIEQQQDETSKALGLVNVTDRIKNNGTHIIFNNDTIEIIKGIPKINLSSVSNNTATDT
jgi:hypothetical protein